MRHAFRNMGEGLSNRASPDHGRSADCFQHDLTTPLFLRCMEVGSFISGFDLLTIDLVLDTEIKNKPTMTQMRHAWYRQE